MEIEEQRNRLLNESVFLFKPRYHSEKFHVKFQASSHSVHISMLIYFQEVVPAERHRQRGKCVYRRKMCFIVEIVYVKKKCD